MGLYPGWLKARAVAWHSGKMHIQNHIQDAMNQEYERQKRKNK